jgi:Uncharacterized protein conserved in bacteria
LHCWDCGRDILGDVNYALGEYESSFLSEILGEMPDNDTNAPLENVESRRLYCLECYSKHLELINTHMSQYIENKAYLMIERAINMLEKQNIEIYHYEEAIKAVGEHVTGNPKKYMSSHEVVAAIILIANEVQTKVQHRIGKYAVDFYLPTLKVVLEIDGYMHQYKRKQDSQRDIAIRNELGREWEIVRIPTKYIEQNSELLVEAIKSIRDEKRKTRGLNSGYLPESYSPREREHYKRLMEHRDAKVKP